MENETRSYSIIMAFSIFAFAVFVTAGLAMFSGPGIAPAYILAAVVPFLCFFKIQKWRIFYDGNLQKVIIVALGYSLISCFWVIDPAGSIKLWSRMVLLAASAFILFEYVKSFNDAQREKFLNAICLGVALAIVIALIEIVTDGFLTKLIRFNQPDRKFELTDLNRGSSFLSLMFWPCIAILLSKGMKSYAAIVSLAILLVVYQLDSTSSLLGLLVGIMIYGLVRKIGRFGVKLLMAGAIFGIIAVPTITIFTTADELDAAIPIIPGAASEYRLYIWDFAGQKAEQKPFLGWGFDASRKIPVTKNDYVLKNTVPGGRHPLPLHTHNNTMQIWLELGVVGLVLFAAFIVTLLDNIQRLPSKRQMALCSGLFSTYFMIGQTGYGIWQNWWVAGGLLATAFLLASFTHSEDQNA